MKALFLCNVDFCAWPAHIAAHMALREPNFVADAMISLDAGTAQALRTQTVFTFNSVECLCDAEEHWLSIGDVDARYSALEARFGSQTLADIATGERELSGDRITGAVFPLTPLRKLSRDEGARRAYCVGLVEHLSAKIEAGGYDAIICYSVQDGVSVAAAFIAKALGIAFLSPKAFGFQAATCLFDDPRNMAPCFRDAFAVAIANPTPHESLMRRGHEALATFRARPAPPDYMVVANGSVSQKPGLLDSAALIWRFLSRRKPENLRYPLPLSRLVFDWRRALMAQRAAKSPLFQPRGALGGKKYIYFPLHYEPEASLLVSSPDETDQIAVLKRLTEALPQGWVIGAKEHRPMLGRRPSGYYERLAAMANIVLISPFEDSFALTQGAALTATITGTAGLESVLLGRPTLFFGDHPIQIIGAGSYRAREEQCTEAVASACATPPASDAQLAAFLGALLTESIQVSAQEIWGGLETISFSRVEHQHQALETMAQLLLNAINRAQKPL